MRPRRTDHRTVRVTLRRSGGFAAIPGLEVRVSLDSQALPPADAEQLEAVVRQAQLDQLPSAPVRGSADGRVYELGVEDGNGLVTAKVTDPLPSQAVRDLVSLLLARGTPSSA